MQNLLNVNEEIHQLKLTDACVRVDASSSQFRSILFLIFLFARCAWAIFRAISFIIQRTIKWHLWTFFMVLDMLQFIFMTGHQFLDPKQMRCDANDLRTINAEPIYSKSQWNNASWFVALRSYKTCHTIRIHGKSLFLLVPFSFYLWQTTIWSLKFISIESIHFQFECNDYCGISLGFYRPEKKCT